LVDCKEFFTLSSLTRIIQSSGTRVIFALVLISISTFLYSNLNEIQLGRVQYDGGGDWYNDPEVLVNFAEFLSQNLPINISNRERVVKLSDANLFQCAFLYMTGHGNIVSTDAEISNLRRYLLRGGFLYVDDDYGLDDSFRKFIARVFPERSLVELPLSHPIFSNYYQFPNGLPKIHEHDNKRPQLFAIFDDAGRTMLLYTYESNISDGWADFGTHQNPEIVRETAFRFGLNMFYHLFVESN